MALLNLLNSLPKTVRDAKLLEERKKLKEWGDDNISRLFGYDFFDGDRKYGYGGYFYDGRYVKVAENIIKHYNLHQGAKVLDIGAAKGFLVYDLFTQGMDAYGIDTSRYAVQHCPTRIIGRLHRGDILDLPFSDHSFDFVISLATIHNIPENLLYLAFNEIQRVGKGKTFITVDSYYDEKQREEFEAWNLTAKSYDTPEWWEAKFAEHNYIGDYYWVIHEFGDKK